ncbi:carbohydrate sulfotransferase 1-like isoform X2 [Anneissia japonica]|nr:carbohydrate sulfotransferase 1-like isoform X2 [Anneissia japonica]XP_033112298.1 carbohydrate sulfotransferase 1-like isoform X2 [Anneissia japonica]
MYSLRLRHRYLLLILALTAGIAFVIRFQVPVSNYTYLYPKEFEEGSPTEIIDGQFTHFLKADSFQKSPEELTRSTNVILLASWRSGSSLTGQFFNQHEEVFYLFEPLKFLGVQRVDQQKAATALKHMFRCEFDNMHHWAERTSADILHRISSKSLISPTLCPSINTDSIGPASENRWMIKKCPPLVGKKVSEICRSYRHKFIKVIRIANVTSLEELLKDTSLNVKIIHLVRDPRALYYSRLDANKNRPPDRSMKLYDIVYTCKSTDGIMQLAEMSPTWMKGKYHIVRYEDIAMQPLKAAQEMYKFMGLSMTPSVRRWILNNTASDHVIQSTRDRLYGLQKNSTAVAHAWRYRAPFSAVDVVQEACKAMMAKAGYIEAKTKRQLRDPKYKLIAKL